VTPDDVRETVHIMRRRLAGHHRSDWNKARRVLLPVVTAMFVIGALAAVVGDCAQSDHGGEGAVPSSRTSKDAGAVLRPESGGAAQRSLRWR
jgi:hypothetical protein